jgi:lysophospholipase L1-like esterase
MEKKPINKNFIFWSLLISFLFITSLVSFELVGQAAYRIHFGQWRFLMHDSYAGFYISHPWLVGVPKPGESRTIKDGKKTITISHNSMGFRGYEVKIQKGNNTHRIIVLGGSTTYCVGVSDNETWPYFLEKNLGAGWRVVNLGVPGYSTVEVLIQTALQIQDLSPDIAVYYEGWNDIRNIHIKNLKSDYSDFHGKSQYNNLQINVGEFSKSIIITLIKKYLYNTWSIPTRPMPTADAFSTTPDYRALDLYGRNLGSIIALCIKWNIIPIMVPQVLNYEALIEDKPNNWVPFLKEKDIRAAMKLYNEKMREVAAQNQVGFVEEVLETRFLSSDFIDNGHFSPSGNKKFATILTKYINKEATKERLLKPLL